MADSTLFDDKPLSAVTSATDYTLERATAPPGDGMQDVCGISDCSHGLPWLGTLPINRPYGCRQGNVSFASKRRPAGIVARCPLCLQNRTLA
jgi:hypothetical protein